MLRQKSLKGFFTSSPRQRDATERADAEPPAPAAPPTPAATKPPPPATTPLSLQLPPSPADPPAAPHAPTPAAGAGGGRRSAARRRINYAESDDDDDDDDGDVRMRAPTTANGRKRRKKQVVSDDDDDDDAYVPDDDGKGGDDDDDDDDDELAGDVVVDADELDVIASAAAPAPAPRPAPVHAAAPSPATPASRAAAGSRAARTVRRQASFKAKNEERYAWLETVRDAQQRRPADDGYDPSTLWIPPGTLERMSNFEQQYWAIKRQQWDTVVFFKKGKFYELYEVDAEIGSRHLGLKMSDRVNMKMSGVPEASFTYWAAKLLALGYKVSRVDQVETPASRKAAAGGRAPPAGKTVLRRELAEVITAGTVVNPELLTDPDAVYLLVLAEDAAAGRLGVCLVEAAAGAFHCGELQDDASRSTLETLLLQTAAREVVFQRRSLSPATTKVLAARQHAAGTLLSPQQPGDARWDAGALGDTLRPYFAVDALPAALRPLVQTPSLAAAALGGCAAYLANLCMDRALLTSQSSFAALESPLELGGRCLVLDGSALQNLDVFDGDCCLFNYVNHTVTPFGRRLLRTWLVRPLRRAEAIRERLDAVDWAAAGPGSAAADAFRTWAARLPDLERGLGRVHARTASIKELVRLLRGFDGLNDAVDELARAVGDAPAQPLLRRALASVPDVRELVAAQRAAFDWDAAVAAGAISPKPGAVPELDAEARAVAELEQQLERVRAALASRLGVTVRFRDLGKERFQLEVNNDELARSGAAVGPELQRMSQTKTVTRYWTAEVREAVEALAEHNDALARLKSEVLQRVLGRVDEARARWCAAVSGVAHLDALLSLAMVARGVDVVRPEIVDAERDGTPPVLDVTGGYHPLVAAAAPDRRFVPNDLQLQAPDATMLLLTGPNMGGKSTLLRQTATLVVLAQLGTYVPARAARLSPVDRIFTRIGASDRILAAQSTFMVELTETSMILAAATEHSLVLLDELGRGTSTFDGYAIAYAVTRELLQRRARVLTATHYHMLTDELGDAPGVRCGHMSCLVDEAARAVTFLYRLAPGVCPKSHGTCVATMAGIPSSIVDRAASIADALEQRLMQIIAPRGEGGGNGGGEGGGESGGAAAVPST